MPSLAEIRALLAVAAVFYADGKKVVSAVASILAGIALLLTGHPIAGVAMIARVVLAAAVATVLFTMHLIAGDTGAVAASAAATADAARAESASALAMAASAKAKAASAASTLIAVKGAFMPPQPPR